MQTFEDLAMHVAIDALLKHILQLDRSHYTVSCNIRKSYSQSPLPLQPPLTKANISATNIILVFRLGEAIFQPIADVIVRFYLSRICSVHFRTGSGSNCVSAMKSIFIIRSYFIYTRT